MEVQEDRAAWRYAPLALLPNAEENQETGRE